MRGDSSEAVEFSPAGGGAGQLGRLVPGFAAVEAKRCLDDVLVAAGAELRAEA
jgi:hypothetical protein